MWVDSETIIRTEKVKSIFFRFWKYAPQLGKHMKMCDFMQGFQNWKAYITKPKKSWDGKIIAVLCTRHDDIDFFLFFTFFLSRQ